MHLALGLTIAPLQGESSFHCIVVSFQSQSKVFEFLRPLFLDFLEPGIQAFSSSLPQHAGKVGDEVICLLDFLISLTQLSQILLLPVETLFLFKGDPMGHLRS